MLVHFKVVSVLSLTHLLSPQFQMHNWNIHTKQLEESPHWFPDLWSEGY